jgi:ribosomal protein L37AE/L43A
MDRRDRTCPLCSRVMAADDTIVFGRYHLSHLDCRQPQALSPEERALLFFYCRPDPIGECARGTRSFRLFELASNPRNGQTHLCPLCREDLSARIRAHLYNCALLPSEVRRRAHDVREGARSLVKRSQQLRDTADVLPAEADAALEKLRQAMRESPVRSR